MKRFCDDPTIFRTEKITRGHPSERLVTVQLFCSLFSAGQPKKRSAGLLENTSRK